MNYTVAQMIAVLSADSSKLDSRLSAVEGNLKEIQQLAERMAENVSTSFTKAAEGAKSLEDQTKELQRAEANRYQFEYEMGRKSVQDYKSFLSQRMDAFAEHTSEWRSAAMQTVTIEREMQEKITSNLAAQLRIRNAMQSASAVSSGGRNWKQALRQTQLYQAEEIYTDPSATIQAQAAAAEKILALTKEQKAEEVRLEEEAAKNRATAISNLARFEYEQGSLTVEAYMEFLRRKMAANAEYTAEYRSASMELVGIQRAQLAEQTAADERYVAERTARLGAMRKIEEEQNAAMIAFMEVDNAAFLRSVQKQANEIAAAHEESAAKTKAAWGKAMNAGGGLAAGITAVEALSGGLAANFDHNITAIGNNTTMAASDIANMRAETLKLHADTAQATDDIAQGYMHIFNIVGNAKDTIKELTWANKEAVATSVAGIPTKTSDVAKALSTSLNVFHALPSEAPGYMDVLHHAAASGDMTVQEFVDKAGPALAIAGAMKDKFYDAAGAMSLLSKGGFNAAEAATQIKSAISHIADPANQTTKYIELLQRSYATKNPGTSIDLMKDFSQQGIEQKGYAGVLNDLFQVTGGNANLIAHVVPALRGGIGTMELTQLHTQLTQLVGDLKKLQEANTGSETQDVFLRMQKDTLQQWKEIASTIETKFIPVGKRAMDIFVRMEPAIEHGADAVVALMNAFQRLPKPIQEVVTLVGGLAIINKFTGLLVGLRVPAAFGASLRVVGGLLNGLSGLLVKGGAASMTLRQGVLAATTQTAGFGEAMTALAASGGPVLLVIAALVGLGIEIYKIKQAYDDMRSAQDQAAKSSADFAAMQARVAAQGPVGSALVAKTKVSQEISDLQGALTDAWGHWNPGFTGKARQANRDSFAASDLRDMGYDATNPAYSTESGIRARIKALQASLGTLTDYLTKAAQAGPAFNHGLPAPGTVAYTGSTAVPSYVASMLKDVGKQVGRDCGAELSYYLGGKGSVSSMDTRANMVSPDANGNYPEGTIFHANPNPNRDRYKHGHYWTLHYINGQPYRLESNVAGNYGPHPIHDVVSVSKPMTKADIAAATWGGRVHAYKPGGGSEVATGAVTDADVAAEAAREKAAKAAEKAAISAHKALLKRYDDELRSLNLIIKATKTKQDLSTNAHRATVEAMLSTKDSLLGIHGQSAVSLRHAADLADAAEHHKYITDAIDKAKDKAAVASLPESKQQALDLMGIDLDTWKKLGNGASAVQKQILDAVHQYNWGQELSKEGKALDDLRLKLASVGNAAKLSAIQAVAGGSAEKWKALSDSQKQKAIDTARQLDIGNSLFELQTQWADKAAASLPPIKTASEEAQRAIDALTKKYGKAVNDPQWQSFIETIKEYGEQTDRSSINNFFTQQQTLLDFQKKALVPEPYEVGAKAIADWEEQNRDMLTMISTFYPDAVKQVQAFEKQIGELAEAKSLKDLHRSARQIIEDTKLSIMNAQSFGMNPGAKAVMDWMNSPEGKKYNHSTPETDEYIRAITAQANAKPLTDLYSGLGNTIVDAMRQAHELTTNDPFQKWLSSYMELQKQVGANGKVTYTFGLPTGTDIGLMKEVYKQIEKFQTQAKLSSMIAEGTQGLSEAVMGGLHAAFSPDYQKRGTLQTSLLSQQQEYMQYQIAEKQFRMQNPGDPNDPYIGRLHQLQKEIGKTQTQINGMGNSLVHAFTRFFTTIEQQFTQTLARIAENYLQSQIFSYLSRQIGTGAGFNGSGGGSSVLGSIVGTLGSVMAGAIGKGMGGGGGANIPVWSDGSQSPGKIGVWGYAKGTYPGVVPGPVGAGDIVPAMLSPGEVVLSVPQVASLRSSGRPIVIQQSQTFNQTVSTPDVRGFRSSKVTQSQEARSFFKSVNRR